MDNKELYLGCNDGLILMEPSPLGYDSPIRALFMLSKQMG